VHERLGRPKAARQVHKKIYLALKAKDPRKAVEAMKQHMLDEERALAAALEHIEKERGDNF